MFNNKQLIVVLATEYQNNNNKITWCITGTYSRYWLVDNFVVLVSNVKDFWSLTSS